MSHQDSDMDIDVTQARRALDQGALLVDVREPDEWHRGHAPEARHIPLGEFAARMEELPADRDIVLICRSGNRSGKAADLLMRQRDDVANVAGGMQAWAQAGLPVVAEGGGPGRVA